MNQLLGTRNLPVRLLLCAAVALMLCSCADSGASASAEHRSSERYPTAAAAEKPRLIVYAGGESPGVEVHSRADAKDLRGAPKAFKRFIGKTAQRLADHSDCQHAYVGVTVERVRTDGFAVGGVNDCGGYAAMWAVVDAHWKEIQGTQDSWECRVLKRYQVPSDIAGHRCYNYRTQKGHHYHQR